MKERKTPVLNRVLDEQHLSLEQLRDTVYNGVSYKTGVSYGENGDTTLTVFAPEAKEVAMRTWSMQEPERFTPRGDGIFNYTIPWKPELGGPMVFQLLVDGNRVLSRDLPVAWEANGPMNQVDIPSVYGEIWSIRRNPHGAVASEIFYSSVIEDFKRCMVYTPPGYSKSQRDYPVLYMLHGGGANELDWFYAGHAAHIFDNLIADGKAEPFIAVATNGMVRFPDSGRVVWDDALECMLVKDIIPYIDANYRTRTDKWSRGICGLSMGSYMTNDIGFRHPELFGYMGTFTASMTHYIDYANYERPFLSVLKEMEQNPQEFARRYRVFFRSTTRREDHFDYFENDDAMLAKAGIDQLPCNYRVVYSEQTSKWDSWRLGLYDYAQLIFR